MTNTRFEQARKKLSQALKSLEDATKEKIHEASMQKGITDENLVIQQNITIQDLQKEINNLQENLENLGDELELVSLKNQALIEKINNYRSKGFGLINAVEADLRRIEDVIKQSEDL